MSLRFLANARVLYSWPVDLDQKSNIMWRPGSKEKASPRYPNPTQSLRGFCIFTACQGFFFGRKATDIFVLIAMMYLCQLDCLLKDLHVCLFLFSVERRLTYLCLAVMYPCQVVLASPSQVRIPQASSRRMLKGKREVDDLMKQFYVHPKVKCKNKLQPASPPHRKYQKWIVKRGNEKQALVSRICVYSGSVFVFTPVFVCARNAHVGTRCCFPFPYWVWCVLYQRGHKSPHCQPSPPKRFPQTPRQWIVICQNVIYWTLQAGRWHFVTIWTSHSLNGNQT